MKYIVLLILFLPLLSHADILVKIGILDTDKISEDFKDAKELRTAWETMLSKKFYSLDLLEKQYTNLLKNKQLHALISEKINYENHLQELKHKIDKIKQQKKEEFENIQATKGKELKKKILLAIREARKKRGFGIILSSKEKLVLYYDKTLDFNNYVMDELIPPDEKKKGH